MTDVQKRERIKDALLARVIASRDQRKTSKRGELIRTAAGAGEYGCLCRWCDSRVKAEHARTITDDDRGGTMIVCADCRILYA